MESLGIYMQSKQTWLKADINKHIQKGLYTKHLRLCGWSPSQLPNCAILAQKEPEVMRMNVSKKKLYLQKQVARLDLVHET